MKIFHCDHCGQLLFFEKVGVSCGRRVAFLPDLRLVGSLDPDGDDTWRSPLPQAVSGYRLCQNDKIEGICNWAVLADDDCPPYRTLLGHMRHESGHYYWDRLIGGTPEVDEFRSLFGDERADYAASLGAYYERGAPDDWQARFVSAYASSHPWEDWAETWAHYLHMVDTLETAAACGLSLRPLSPS